MADSLLPDTNAVIGLFAGHEGVAELFRSAPNVLASCTVVGELYYGALHSSRVAANVARVDAFVAGNIVLGCDLDTARQYGAVKAALRRKGRMIPDNDLWIATTRCNTT